MNDDQIEDFLRHRPIYRKLASDPRYRRILARIADGESGRIAGASTRPPRVPIIPPIGSRLVPGWLATGCVFYDRTKAGCHCGERRCMRPETAGILKAEDCSACARRMAFLALPPPKHA